MPHTPETQKTKVVIVGAGRSQNGIGPYIARYTRACGAEVTAVLGKTMESARAAAAGLSRYDIKASAYADFSAMVLGENPDAMIIASPSATHRDYLDLGLDAGMHILCEKPFVDQADDEPRGIEHLFERAKEKSLTLAMNSQWPFSMPFYEKLCGGIEQSKIVSFTMHLSPVSSGKEMIPDSVPHALSLLYTTCGPGALSGLEIRGGPDEMTIGFDYSFGASVCRTHIHLARQTQQPRTFSFGFNHKTVSRRIDSRNYDIYFTRRGKSIKIVDPLRLSIADFLASVTTGREPVIGRAHITHTAALLKQINDGWR